MNRTIYIIGDLNQAPDFDSALSGNVTYCMTTKLIAREYFEVWDNGHRPKCGSRAAIIPQVFVWKLEDGELSDVTQDFIAPAAFLWVEKNQFEEWASEFSDAPDWVQFADGAEQYWNEREEDARVEARHIELESMRG